MSGPYIFHHSGVTVWNNSVKRAKPRLCLPRRMCDVCGEYQVHLELARFGFKISKEIDLKVLRGNKTLATGEFDALVKRLTRVKKIREALLPGTEIGPAIYNISGTQGDFLWDGICPIVSEKVLACVRARKIKVDAVEVEVTGRDKAQKRYFSFLPAIRNLMAADWLSQEMYECSACKQWQMKLGIRLRKKVLIGRAHVVKRRWPAGMGVVYSPDLGDLLFSPEFVRACDEAQLVGAAFHQVRWV